MFDEFTNHIRKKRETCSLFDLPCLLRQQKETAAATASSNTIDTTSESSLPSSSSPPSTESSLKEATELIDIDNAIDTGITPVRETRSTDDDKKANIAGMHDDEDYVTQDDSSGEIVEGSGEVRDRDNTLHYGGYNTEPISPSPTNPPILGQPRKYF